MCWLSIWITYKNHHSIFRKLKKNYNPDFIFTSGKITQEIFEENSNYSNTIISILGSYKKEIQIICYLIIRIVMRRLF